MSPHQLAVATVQLYHDLRCDRVAVEKNHGGKWIPALIKTVDRSVPVSTVWASEGKRTRAEPIAALFEPDRDYPTGRCHIVGRQDQLEGELTSYTGLPGEVSPNLLDAMVWACTQLGLAPASGGVGYFGGMAAAQSQIWKPA
jgi:phage terminase large subunit-like protein